MRMILLLTTLAGLCCRFAASKEQKYEDMHMVMLRFTLDGDNPYEFASRASQFAESLEEILSEVYEFDDVNAVILGVGKSSCGVTVVAVLEYSVNQTSSIYGDTDSIVDYIVSLVEENKNVLGDIYIMKSVRYIDTDEASINFITHKNRMSSMKIVLGVVAGTLSLIGVAALVAGLVVYTLKGKSYEKVPLLADEQAVKNKKWLKLPWNKNKDTTEAF